MPKEPIPTKPRDEEKEKESESESKEKQQKNASKWVIILSPFLSLLTHLNSLSLTASKIPKSMKLTRFRLCSSKSHIDFFANSSVEKEMTRPLCLKWYRILHKSSPSMAQQVFRLDCSCGSLCFGVLFDRIGFVVLEWFVVDLIEGRGMASWFTAFESKSWGTWKQGLFWITVFQHFDHGFSYFIHWFFIRFGHWGQCISYCSCVFRTMIIRSGNVTV